MMREEGTMAVRERVERLPLGRCQMEGTGRVNGGESLRLFSLRGGEVGFYLVVLVEFGFDVVVCACDFL